ncbi:hypothetical protein PsorP6_015732 [Peronosclerospora sorghi]|uniref:Uncharacterized protein n=1 Tax=Peronosclerospora sorghi TaxID=230839 RepID=A0ACC0WN38_9STRA|nr:hypothetical protein PsorP6_015732 [Peronosclerospora sorghi]
MTSKAVGTWGKLWIQLVFLLTGVFSTCIAQFVFYQGAGDQKAMILPLCNYLGMMLVGVLPLGEMRGAKKRANAPDHASEKKNLHEVSEKEALEPELTPMMAREGPTDMEGMKMELTRRSAVVEDENEVDDVQDEKASALGWHVTSSSITFSFSTLQLCILVSVVLDFAGCIFSNLGLYMAGSGLYQVVYSSVICWSALLSRVVLNKVVSKEEWVGIALVTFGLAFSALEESGSGRENTLVLMGCFNTLVGAALYGGNYVTGEYTLKLSERPHPQDLCLKIGAACVSIIAIYQSIFVLPEWETLVTHPIAEAKGNTTLILSALVAYLVSQLAHGLTYFMMLGSSGAVTTGIMQSLRAVCVFAISSILYCSHQESQCLDTKRGVATVTVVTGVMVYSWAKSLRGKASISSEIDTMTKIIAGKSYIV